MTKIHAVEIIPDGEEEEGGRSDRVITVSSQVELGVVQEASGWIAVLGKP